MNKLRLKIIKNKARIAISVLVLLVFLGHAAGEFKIPLVERLENITYDVRVRMNVSSKKDDSVVIIDIDEKSLTAEGRWPWSRDKVARLVSRSFDTYNVSLLGFDVVFAEPDESSGLSVLEKLAETQFKAIPSFSNRLAELRSTLDYDEVFAQTISQYPVVLGLHFNVEEHGSDAEQIGELPEPVMKIGTLENSSELLLEANAFSSNLPKFNRASLGAGHFSQQPDIDGVVRRQPALISVGENVYPSLALEIVRNALGGGDINPVFESSSEGTYRSLEWLNVGDAAMIPVDHFARVVVPYRGMQGSFDYVSATDILQGTASKETLENKIVLVGTTAPGLFDMRATPVSEVFPGVEVHANLVAGMLKGLTLRKPEFVRGYEIILLTVSGLIMIAAGTFLSPFHASIFGILMIGNTLSLAYLGWSEGLILPVASGLFMIVTMFTLHMSYGYFVETRGKKLLTGLFGQYVPPELVQEMSASPESYDLNAESKELTVLFSDVRGFTSISEVLSPKDLADLMNDYLTPMTAVIHHAKGTIDKYMGDAIMAFWGAPISDEDHARHGLYAAVEMLEELKKVNSNFKARGWPVIEIGIGVHSGLMNVGNMGSEFRMAYTVLGDNVNLGSRVEGLTKIYGVDLLCTQSTADLVSEYFYREIDKVRVKGKETPVTLFEPFYPNQKQLTESQEWELKSNAIALSHYRERRWEKAMALFLELKNKSGKPARYEIFLDRLSFYVNNPPPDNWDGVFDHLTK